MGMGAWTRLRGGGVDLQRGCFSVKMYVKMKELGPMGGVLQKILYVDPPMLLFMMIKLIEIKRLRQGVGSADDLFSSSSVILKEYIITYS